MRRVQLLTHSYWPESTPPQRRWQRLTASLVDEGWEVDVVTPAADPRQTPAAHQDQGRMSLRAVAGPAGERILRLPRLLLRDSRMGRFASDAAAAALMVPRALGARRPDVVVATVPALPVICAGWMAARLRRVPLVVDMRDAWPDLAREAGVRAGPAGRLMESVVTGVQRDAALVVTVTSGFADRLAARGVQRVATISNGVDLAGVPELTHRPREAGTLRVAYLGNHGESQALDAAIDAVRTVHRAGEVDVVLRLIGSGTQKERLRDRAGDCPAIEFHDPCHGEQVWEHYRWADSALVSLRTDWASFAWTVPSKTFELLGLGKHITAAVTGEAAETLRQAENVRVLDDAGEGRAPVDRLAEALTSLARDPDSTPISRSGRRWVAEHADLPALGRRYSALLEELVPHGSSTDPRANAARSPVDWDRLWVCVCTYRRDDLLVELLESLRAQRAPQLPRLLVVDNDPDGGSADTVRRLWPEARWVHQPRPGIAAARNAGLDALPEDADAVVFVDDDERAAPDWLAALVRTADASGADTVSGPVRSLLPPGIPADLADEGFIRRIDFPTGPWAFRPATNNVLVRADWFTQEPAFRFDEDFNFSGGEDSELFGRLQAAGAQSWWCAEAEVSEDVPAERATPEWMRARGVRSGHVRAKKAAKVGHGSARIAGEAMTRIALGAGRVALRRLQRRRVGYQDSLWLREGVGMLQTVTGRAREEYAR
ncbi:glycosyltransferase [Nesterenkonia xinjiangensis]|uniref:Glycosyltransferase involved in cell wall biosynthesis n=1 Tax=Nesterenkonia xinjiangensis TaxID=225327 RepID=A0A7Z0GNP1_9MICC|nr:glycosyltransferase involved in cell wall biosynthesis [Nesterenkonia xinjiangensis]